MRLSWSSCPNWANVICSFSLVLQYALAYRPVQHCKTLGDNGHYSACAAITQHYNATTGQSDMYLRYHWYRYRSSKNGWHSFAIGQQMAGALMLIMYGDSTLSSIPMTVDVRTSEGHSPPRPVAEVTRYAQNVPDVEIVTATFEEYKGNMKIESLNESPTHVGICEAIIRGYEKWTGFKTSNTSVGTDMIWSSNYKQDMDHDFSHGRNIDMHSFGLGFGFLYVDILNALTPEPMFGPLDEMAGMKGVAETRKPEPPTAKELADGETYIAQQKSQNGQATPPSTASPTAQPPATTGQAEKQGETSNNNKEIEQPARTLLGKSLRDWMWHLHGLMMTIAFLALYPLGTYLIRSGNAQAFKLHWTVQALATIAMAIGTIIGYMNSHGISVRHQYIGIALAVAVVVQGVLGWRHHMQFMATKRKGWLSKAHIVLGRVFLPLGYVNIILGMLLRGYGWFTITLAVIAIGIETAFLTLILYRASKNRGVSSELRAKESGPPRDDEAEEYFQLAGEDEFSDSDGEHDEEKNLKEQEKRDQADRLRRLDRV